MLLDTHCHLDAHEFTTDRDQVIQRAQDAGVGGIIIPAVAPYNFDAVRRLAHSFVGGRYALGIHPICIPDATEADLTTLEAALQKSLDDPRLVAIGEIGLDYFIPALKEPAMREKQEHFYAVQLQLAKCYKLPLIIHVRRSHDILLKHLRRHAHIGGIAHAFNGSFQQAQQFIDLGFALGFGGAMTFSRARQIRRLAEQLPLESLVLETDAPDIPPAWLGQPPGNQGDSDTPLQKPRNEPGEVARMVDCLAELRGMTRQNVITATFDNACRVLPRLNC